MVDREDRSRLRDLVVRGTEISAAVAGTAAVAQLTAEPNAVVSLLFGEAPLFAGTIAWIVHDYLDRHLSQRERLRVDTAITFATHKAYQHIMNGEKVRSEEFFQPERQGGRRPSEEIAEAVALAVQREPEERKVKHIGFILGNLAFSPSLDRISGNFFVRLAEELSYAQMQLLALVGRRSEIALPSRIEEPKPTFLRGHEEPRRISWKAGSVERQFADLGYGNKELILPEPRKGERLPENITVPADQRLTGFGQGLYSLMDLHMVPIEELQDVATALWEASGERQPTGA